MPIVILMAVVIAVAIQATDVLPASSVGGPMTLLAIHLAAMLVLGVYEAIAARRGVLGWAGSILAAFLGGFVGMVLASMAMEEILMNLSLDGTLATSTHPFRYIAAAGMMLMTLLGAWGAIKALDQVRDR